MPRDRTGLDGTAWKDSQDTETARRRESTTGVDARNRKTYSQVTAPKPEKKIIPKDFGVLTALQEGREKSKNYLSRQVARYFPLSGRRKMVKEEKGAMMKQEQEMVTTDMGKANGTADKLFDKKLYHVLTVISNLKLDGGHIKYRDILYNNNVITWDDFNDFDGIDEIKNLKYTDGQGNVVEFLKREKNRLTKLWNFKSYVKDDNDEVFHKPLTWTRPMYDDWCIEKKIFSDGSSGVDKGSRVGKDIDIKPEPALSNLSIPLGLSQEEVLVGPKNENAKNGLPSELILTTIQEESKQPPAQTEDGNKT